jgi:hypothetical protein
MDILSGLSAATQAIGLVKELRSIDRTLDDAEFKLKIVDLASALSDAKLALVDAQERVRTLEDELARLKLGDVCPVCREGRLKVIKVQRHDISVYTEFHTTRCSNADCCYENQRMFDANSGAYG